MTNTPELSYSFFTRINSNEESQLHYWSKKFSIESIQLKKIIQIAGPVVKDIHDYLQTLKPRQASLKSHQQLVNEYSVFINNLCNSYSEDYNTYVAEGGTESFLKCCWRLMMKEAVEEAATIVEAYEKQVPDALKLIDDLQTVACNALLKSSSVWAK